MQGTDFLATLIEMRNGEVARDVSRKFNELLTAVLATARKGELTLKITVNPSKLKMGGAVVEVETTHSCNVKLPELPVGGSLFFVGSDGRLTRDDPAQTDMFVQDETQEMQRG